METLLYRSLRTKLRWAMIHQYAVEDTEYSFILIPDEQWLFLCVGALMYVKVYHVFQVKELLWNSDSTVLAVWLEDLTPGVNRSPNTYS